ncbi:MAG TPA: phosphocholine cytidylyltransferase family protein [Ohtaekwangia sp.]
MKIVILAAGIGSRLGNPLPKPLTILKNGQSIMQQQIENLTKHFDIDNINIVVGFKKDLIMESFPDITYIYNQLFDQTNTSKSLLKALKKNHREPVMWLNGDVVFDSDILKELTPIIIANKSFVCVNTQKVGDEEVKYTLDDQGFIKELSKKVQNGIGEAVGINFVSSKDINTLIGRLEECNDNDYFERGIEMSIEKDGMKVSAVDISKFRCMEIDFREDLDKANNIF